MISLDDNEYDRDIKQINQRLETMNSYLTALTQISSLTYLTSLSTLTAYANDIISIKYDTFEISKASTNYFKATDSTVLNNYLLSSNSFNTSVLNNYLLSSKSFNTSVLNSYLLSSETSSLTFNSSVLSLSDYLKKTDYVSFDSSVLGDYLLTSDYVSFDSSVLNSYLLSSDYVSFDSSVLNSYLLTSDYVSFDSSILNNYLLSSKTTDFAGTSISTLSTLSTLSSLTYLTTLSNTPYMIDAHITDTNLYLYNVSRMTNFNPGTIMGNYSIGYNEEKEINSNWMNSYDHLLSFNSMNDCLFSFATSDSVSHYVSTDRRIGFTANTFYNNTLTHFDTLSGKNFSNNKLSYITHMTGDYAFKNSIDYATDIKIYHDYTNTYNYADNLSVNSGSSCKYTGMKNFNAIYATSCTFEYCAKIDIYALAVRCSFTNSIGELYMRTASYCSGYVDNCTVYSAVKNYLTARSFTVGTADNCTFQTCDSINFNQLLFCQMWAPHYLKGGTISSGSITGDNLVMDVGYIDGVYFGHVCRGTISFSSMGRPFTIASANYPQDIVVSYNLHPYRWASNTYYFSLSADLSSSFTLHVYNIQNVRPSFQNATISNYLCLDCLGPRGVFSNGSYSYSSLTQYCPTSRLSYNGVPWAAIQH